MLQSFLVSGAHQYDFKASRITTLTRWEQELLYQYGVRTDPPDDFEEQPKYLIGKIEELIETRKIEKIYEATLLDEAQDYIPAEIRVFRRFIQNALCCRRFPPKNLRERRLHGRPRSRGGFCENAPV